MNNTDNRIVRRLIEIGDRIGGNELVFVSDPMVGDLLKDDPFAFLLAASIDRGMKAETVWRVPGKIKAALGHLDPTRISAMTCDEMLAVLRQIDGKPRYLTAAARTLVEVAGHVVERYGGDPRNLWKNQRADTIKKRLLSIHGIGTGIAAMIVILLDKFNEVELLPEDYAGMDPKPDVNVQRVFQRLGLCARDPTEHDVVAAARRVHPEYPGRLDGAASLIGRTWCHAAEPSCPQCELHDLCPKVI